MFSLLKYCGATSGTLTVALAGGSPWNTLYAQHGFTESNSYVLVTFLGDVCCQRLWKQNSCFTFSNRFIFIVCTWWDFMVYIWRFAAKEWKIIIIIIFKYIYIYISVFTFKGSVMALLSTVHVAVQRTWLNLLKQLNKAELLCLFNYRDSSLRVEAVIFCRAKTILGLKALALVSHCLSFVVIHL